MKRDPQAGPPAPRIAVNGRFLGFNMSATRAVARHLTCALHEAMQGPVMEVIVPREKLADGRALGLPCRPAGPFSGNLWEQTTLPLAARGRLLLNLATRSPLAGGRMLTMVHDAQVFTAPESYEWFFRETLKVNLRAAGARQLGLLTISEFARRDLVRLGIAPAERIHVIPNGVDHVLRVAPEDGVLGRLGLVPRGYAVGLSNTLPYKNIRILLAAFGRPALAHLKLALVGKTSRAALQAATGIVPSANVVFPGYVTEGEIRSLYAQALTLCMPSLTEGFGLPPVEAMRLGAPAVIAPCGALPEVCGPAALTADPRDAAAWEAAVLRLGAEPDLWRALSQAGAAWAARFTWKAAAARLIDVMGRVTAGEGTAA